MQNGFWLRPPASDRCRGLKADASLPDAWRSPHRPIRRQALDHVLDGTDGDEEPLRTAYNHPSRALSDPAMDDTKATYFCRETVRTTVTHRILVPFELPDAEPLSRVLVEDLRGLEVVVLGHFGLPEQTPTDSARAQFEAEAQAELDELARPFEETGSLVETRLVFGKDRSRTIDRVAIEEDCDAELDPAPTEGIERILVPLVDAKNLVRLEAFIRTLSEDRTQEVTLFHVAETGPDGTDGEDPETVEAMLHATREEMIAGGFDPGLVDVSVVASDDHDEAILSKAEAYDAVVMDGAAPDGLRERIFGTLPDKIADRTGDPVIVVRRDY